MQSGRADWGSKPDLRFPVEPLLSPLAIRFKQPVREVVSYRGLFTAGWFGVREKHCSWLEIYDRLRASEQADRMEGVEYIKYSASPKLWVEGRWRGRLYVEVVIVVEVKVVG